MSQMSFSSLAFREKKKVTRREQFLQEMDQVTPWCTLEALIEPYYPKAGNGRRPTPLSVMLRISLLQQWFALSDPAMEDALYDSTSMQRFAGLELGQNSIPDETTILHFRHLLEKHNLTSKLFEAVNGLLQDKGILLKHGTLTDATIIHAPSSTKNRDRARDGEMSSTKKGSTWHFGMKAHVGACSKSGLVHTLETSTASVHDSQKADELLHGQEKERYGDKAYADEGKRQEHSQRGVKWRVTIKASRGRELSQQEQKWNQSRNRVRSRVEHSFGVVKHLWGYRKVRYRGLYKNRCQLFSLFLLCNLYRARKSLIRIQKYQLAQAG